MSNPLAKEVFDKASKAKEKVKDLEDKIACEEEIATANLGYELTRALNGLTANKMHLKNAEESFKECENEEEELIQTVGEKDAEREQALQDNLKEYETNLSRLKDVFDKKNKEIEANYKSKTGKLVKKNSEKFKLLKARVSRFQDAVRASEEAVERLRSNTPKSIIRASYALKKPQRDINRANMIEQMNADQAKSRDATSNKEVAKQPENMIDDEACMKVFSAATGVDMASLANDRIVAQSSERARMKAAALLEDTRFKEQAEKDAANMKKEKDAAYAAWQAKEAKEEAKYKEEHPETEDKWDEGEWAEEMAEAERIQAKLQAERKKKTIKKVPRRP